VNSHGSGYPLGLTGATAATRYVGATAAGAPASGTFAVGDFIIDQSGKVYVCTVDGTPGTWAAIGGVTPPVLLTAPDATTEILTLVGAAAQTGHYLRIQTSSSGIAFVLDPQTGLEVSANPDQGRSALMISPNAMTFVDEAGDTVVDIEGGYISLGASGTVVVYPTGHLVITSHAAPADGDLSAGDCALWFDQTNGAGNTKLMVKGKSADGTVKTATILLA